MTLGRSRRCGASTSAPASTRRPSPGDGRRVDAGADVEAPHLLERPSVICGERAVVVTEEDEVAGGGERARIVRIGELQGGLGFAGDGIDRLEAAIAALGVLAAAARKAVARL